MTSSNVVLRHAIALTVVTAVALPVSAQDDDGLIEEIVVTARKREESLQDVPFSIAALTEEIMRARGITTLEDLSRNVAGFSVQNLGPGQSQVAIRGVSAGQIVRDQPGVKEQVGVYLDESVISLSLFTPDLDVFDMNRIEVLRGPQGTLFGSGAVSGVVRYITNQPILGEFEGFAELNTTAIDGGDTGGYGKVMFNLPLSDASALRVVAYYRADPGFVDAVQPDGSVRRNVNQGDIAGTRIALRFEPNDRLTITPRLVYQDVEIDGFARFDNYNILANPFTTTQPAFQLGETEQFTQLTEEFTDEFTLVDLTIAYDLNDSMTLISVTSFTDREILMVRDATQLTASFTGGNAGLGPEIYRLDAPLDDATDVEVFTQELRLSGGNEDLQWVGGMFYSDIERQYGQSLLVPGVQAATGRPSIDIRADTDEFFFSDIPYDFKQIALFGEATWSVTNRLDLTAGLRYYDFDEDRVLNTGGIFVGGTIGQLGNTSSDGFSPRVMISYALTDDIQINGQISKGFRLGGINDPLNETVCTPEDLATFGGIDSWKDEELWNYEIGLKRTIMGGRGTLNLAAFYMDIENLQATLTAGTCSSRVIFNVPEAEASGVELEWAARVNAHFDFAVSASWIDSKLQSTATTTDANGVVSPIAGVVKGNPLPTVPQLQLAAAGTYTWNIGSGWEGYATAVYQYVDERFTQFGDQDPNFGRIDLTVYPLGDPNRTSFEFDPLLPDYSIVNLRIGARNDQWEVSFFINNLTDELAFLALDQERGTLARQGYLINQPRSYGVTARFSF